jgi:OOP family OmpA-OmpF porin
MKKIAVWGFVSIFSLAFGAVEVSAGNRPHAFTLTPQGGVTVFEGNRDLDPAYSGGLALGYNFSEHWGAEGVVTYGSAETSDGTATIDVTTVRLDTLYHFRPQKDFVPFVAFSLGGIDYHLPSDNNEDGIIGYGIGMKYFLPEGVALRLDVRHLFDITLRDTSPSRDYYHMLYASSGIMFQFGGDSAGRASNDADSDGIVDACDLCAATAPGVAVDSSGCPLDSDRDGVYDYLDACAATPPLVTVDNQGCPLDSDGDGVTDQLDHCPQTPAATPVDAAGCPAAAGATIDADGDGVADGRDRCPNTPSFVPVNENGCPRDGDGDGVFDVEDQCPPSAPGSSVDANGCSPLEGGVAAAPLTETDGGTLVMRLEFHPGETAVLPQFNAQLAQAGAFISQNPGVTFVVEGHTDSVGPSEYNRELSRKRAENVRSQLIGRYQIDPSRLKAVGKGESEPVGDNSTQEGRMQNRRVVIKPIE